MSSVGAIYSKGLAQPRYYLKLSSGGQWALSSTCVLCTSSPWMQQKVGTLYRVAGPVTVFEYAVPQREGL